MSHDPFKKLETRLEDLLDACRRLKQENSALKSEHQELSRENARLMEKTHIARTRIETVIGRLKALERSE